MISYGEVRFRFGDEEEQVGPVNYGPSAVVRTAFFKRFVAYASGMNNMRQVATVGIDRFSKLRYNKETIVPDVLSTSLINGEHAYYQDGNWAPTNIDFYSRDFRNGKQASTVKNVALTGQSSAIGSIGAAPIESATAAYPPAGINFSYPYASIVDLHGTVVGNKFKHPIGRNAYFNEVGQVATSQGNLAVVGVYDPPENMAYHTAYQVYYTKSGGTGKATGTSGSDGSTLNNNTFRSAGYSFVAGDVGKYIKVTDGQGDVDEYIYKIDSLSGTDAVTDAVTVNQPFVAHAGADIVWELVEGPIAEYFVRRRRYTAGDSWAQGLTYGTRIQGGAFIGPAWGKLPSDMRSSHTQRILHDRGACWWWLADIKSATYEKYGLWRWLDTGINAADPVYADGDITNMPAGILDWRHMDIDKNNKLWIATDDTVAATGYSLFYIDPYPLDGGQPNSRYPECTLARCQAKQTNYATAGLPTKNVKGVHCDNDNGDVTHGRTWAMCGTDGVTPGGIWYSEDGGSTMKGLVHQKSALTGTDSWSVAGDGVTVTNDSLDSSLTTELVAGEWITFQDGLKSESKRQVASITDDDTLVLTAATAFGGAVAAMSMKKGAISSAYIDIYQDYVNVPSYNVDSGIVRLGLDHDTDGRLHWAPLGYGYVCRFDPSSTLPVAVIDAASLSAGYGTMGRVHTVGVSRMPDPCGLGPSIWHDNVWVGGGYQDGMTRLYGWESYVDSGQATAPDQFQDAGRPFTAADIGKRIKIYKATTGSNNATRKITNVVAGVATLDGTALVNETNLCWELFGTTRYLWAAGPPANVFPDVVYMHFGSDSDNNTCLSMIQERTGGCINIVIRNRQQNTDRATVSAVQTMLPPTNASCGSVYAYYNVNTLYAYYNSWVAGSEQQVSFDDVGTGALALVGFHEDQFYTNDPRRWHMRQWAPFWMCLVWDGGQWLPGPLNSHLADLDFDASETIPGPYAEFAPTPGYGTRRVTDWAVPLEHGLALRFDQAGGGTSQVNEFVADENTTFVCAIGRIKDNTMTADWSVSTSSFPTVVRLDEPSSEIGSPWTVVGGWDGGFVNSADDQAMPIYCRGTAEGDDYANGNGVHPEYLSFWSHVGNNPANPQYMAAMRIHDQLVRAAGGATGLDIFTTGGVGKATASEGAIFVTADVGKTIRVEGASNPTNNTSRVITALDGASPNATVILDAPWPSADENDLAWRLRDIPETSYAVFMLNIQENLWPSFDWRLLSSRDGGKTWDEVKWTDDVTGLAADALISTRRDPGVYFSRCAFNPVGNDFVIETQTNRFAITFDLTTSEMTGPQRRRTHWKVVRTNPNGSSGTCAPMSLLLLDNNLAPVINPGLMPSDRADPLWFGLVDHGFRAIVHESVGAVTIGQSQTQPINFGDQVNEAGAGYWLQDDTDLKTYAGTSQVSSALGTFTWQDIGRKLRVPNADVVLGVDETYSGFMTIVSLVDANTVTVERTFNDQGTGAITSVTDNGGEAQFNAAGHTLANGDPVTISGTSVYDGANVAANVVAGVSFEVVNNSSYISNATGAWSKGQTGLTWATLNFGATDRVRFYDTTTVYKYLGRPLAVETYEVVDVPTTNQLRVRYMNIPDSVTAAFAIERAFENVALNGPYGFNWETGFNAFVYQRSGLWGVWDAAQFLIMASDVARSAQAEADSDGDGWSDVVTLTGFNVADAAEGDWLLLYSPATQADDHYRRWYKIKSVTPGANTVVEVYEDEIKPSETFKWKIARKRDMKMRGTYCVTAVREPV